MFNNNKIQNIISLTKIHFLLPALILFLFTATNLFANDTNDSLTNLNYQTAYEQLNNMLNGKSILSFEEAIFEIENAYHDNTLSKKAFTETLNFHTNRILQLANANKDRVSKPFQFENSVLPLSPSGRAGEGCLLNWAIFTYLTDTTFWKQENTYVTQYPMQYAKQDPYGNDKWEVTMVSNLVSSTDEISRQSGISSTNNSAEKAELSLTKIGNCFSLSALYYIFSLRLQSNAFLSTAPQHIFIQHKGFDGNYYNIEIPTQSFPCSGTIKTYTYTTHEAITKGIAMKRLNEKEAVALSLVYLAKGYEKKLRMMNAELRMKEFELNCVNVVLKYDSTNLSALLFKEQVLEEKIKNELTNNNYETALENISKISDLIDVVTKLHDYGYEPMPGNMQELLMAETSGIVPFAKSTKKIAPFQQIDNKQNYYTLSKNKFPELHETKNAYSIGMVSLNIEAATIAFDNTLAFAITNTDPVLFALSIDPLAQKFPSMSPYNSMNNNPILFIDPTGEAALKADQLIAEAAKRKDIQEGTVALFTLSNMLKPGDDVSGTEIVKALPSDFKSKSPAMYGELKRVKSVTNTDGTIIVETTDGNPLVFGEEGSGFIIVQNNATFKISTDGNTLKMSAVKNIILSDNRKGEGMLSATSLQAAVIDKKGNAVLDGKLKDGEVNLGKVVTGQ